jgi:hypothetical protein
MKINTKFLTKNGKSSYRDINHIDLSNLHIAMIENLEAFINLKYLILKNNEINCLYGLERNRQLWQLDISNNRVKNLDGLSKFVALGTLKLHGNDLNWIDLEAIRHLHIIDLFISNNTRLEKESNYRNHVIDCLPNVWMVDGLMVTSLERNQVNDFFNTSALSSRPVRRKLPKYQFVPSDLKTRDIFGEWATRLLTKIAINETKNIETDLRRLEFIALWFEDFIQSECKHARQLLSGQLLLESDLNSVPKCNSTNEIIPLMHKNFLKELLDYRKIKNEMCNMILVLLVASLQFKIPLDFIKETLVFINLDKINDHYVTFKLFQLPRVCRLYCANLLLSAAKIDRDQQIEAGFYENLFTSLKNILNEQCRIYNSITFNLFDENEYWNLIDSFSNTINIPNVNQSILKDNKQLLSTEIVQLFSIIPVFYEYLEKNQDLMEILKLSISDVRIFDAIKESLADNRQKNKSLEEICEDLGSFITNMLRISTRQLINKKLKRTPKSILVQRPSSLTRSSPVSQQQSKLVITPTQIVQASSPPQQTTPRRAQSSKNRKEIKLDIETKPECENTEFITSSVLVEKQHHTSFNLFSSRSGVSDVLGDKPLFKNETTNNKKSIMMMMIGESVLVANRIQKNGKIIKISDDDQTENNVLIQFDENDETLINSKNYQWDSTIEMWRPLTSIGNNM